MGVKKVRTVFFAAVLVGASALLVGYGVKTADAVIPFAQSRAATQEKSENQKAFEEKLAKERAAFEERYNEAKRRNDMVRKKFDSLDSRY